MIEIINSDFAKLTAVLIAIIAIVVVFLRHRPNDSNTRSIHLWYISSILIFIIIGFVTYVVVGNSGAEDIMSYVSFASTLSSMILSVIAIFITVMSNDSLGRVKDMLVNLPKDVKEKVDKSIEEMSDVSNNIKESTAQNEKSQTNIIERIQGLISELDTHISNELQKNNERFDSLDERLSNLTKEESLPNGNQSSFTEDPKEIFLENTSYLSLQVICAFEEYKSLNVTGPISITELLKCLGYNDGARFEMYALACIVLLSAMGFVSHTRISDDDFDKILINGIDADFKKAFDEHFENNERINNTRNRLREYYGRLKKDSDGEDKPKQ